MSECWILIKKGKTQRLAGVELNGEQTRTLQIASSREDAKKLAAWHGDPDITTALIGSIEGETLEGHIKIAMEDGCEVLAHVIGWNPDGSPEYRCARLVESL